MSRSDRPHALHAIAARAPEPHAPVERASIEDFGCDVFGEHAIRKYLPKAVADKLLATINAGAPLDPAIAEDVAHGMKEWAVDRGATHFTHWFMPLNGGTAEKHDAFLEPSAGGKAVLKTVFVSLIISGFIN